MKSCFKIVFGKKGKDFQSFSTKLLFSAKKHNFLKGKNTTSVLKLLAFF